MQSWPKIYCVRSCVYHKYSVVVLQGNSLKIPHLDFEQKDILLYISLKKKGIYLEHKTVVITFTIFTVISATFYPFKTGQVLQQRKDKQLAIWQQFLTLLKDSTLVMYAGRSDMFYTQLVAAAAAVNKSAQRKPILFLDIKKKKSSGESACCLKYYAVLQTTWLLPDLLEIFPMGKISSRSASHDQVLLSF